MVRQHQTSDVQLHIGESRDSGFEALHRPGMTEQGALRSSQKRIAYAALLPSWRLASNRNQVRRSVSSMKSSSSPAVPESSLSSASLWALRIAAAICLLSSFNSRS